MQLIKLFRWKKWQSTFYGMDIQDSAIYLIGCERETHRQTINTALRLVLPDGIVQNSNILQYQALSSFLAQLRKQVPCRQAAVAIAVPSQTTISKNILLESDLTALEIEQHLSWQLPNYLNIAAENVYFDYEILSVKQNEQLIRLVAVRREEVNLRKELLQIAGWQVVGIDTEPLAFERAVRMQTCKLTHLSLIALFDLKLSSISLYIIQQGRLIFNRTENFQTPQQEDNLNLIEITTTLQRLWQWFMLVEPNLSLPVFLLSGKICLVNTLMQNIAHCFSFIKTEKNLLNVQPVHPLQDCKSNLNTNLVPLDLFTTEFFLSWGLAMRDYEV